jgi:hypothetical protein
VTRLTHGRTCIELSFDGTDRLVRPSIVLTMVPV